MGEQLTYFLIDVYTVLEIRDRKIAFFTSMFKFWIMWNMEKINNFATQV